MREIFYGFSMPLKDKTYAQCPVVKGRGFTLDEQVALRPAAKCGAGLTEVLERK